LWSWGLVTGALGMLLTLLALEPEVFRIAGGVLIAAAQMTCFAGAIGYSRVRVRQRYLVAGFIACIVPALLEPVIANRAIRVDAVTPTPAAVALFLFTAWAMIWRSTGRTGRSGRLVALSVAFAAVAWALRLVVVVAGTAEMIEQTWPYFALAQMAAVIAGTFGQLLIELRKREHTMGRFATADPVTGLPNRRAAMLRFKDELSRAQRHQRTLALVVLQVNRMAQIQKMRGPAVCDAVIGHVAEAVREAVRDEDVITRVGNEALVLLLPEQLEEGAYVMADRLCDRVATTPCQFESWPINLTMSRGVAVYPEDGTDWDSLFNAASQRMASFEAAQKNPRPKKQSA
jgi:diguanylate cyclase (GGDEF)-like protein